MTILFYDYAHLPAPDMREAVADFLYTNLGEYGDPRSQILQALDYALRESEAAGGFVCIAFEEGQIVGSAIINRTGMKDYIPENILVYIAIHNQHRGRGMGRTLMTEVIRRAEGGIALHVEPDNPARHLYETLGFTQKYLEMRLNR